MGGDNDDSDYSGVHDHRGTMSNDAAAAAESDDDKGNDEDD